MTKMLKRNIEAAVTRARTDRPVVAIIGPRQAGKSTLAQAVLRDVEGSQYVTLDDAGRLAAARSDPVGFIAQFGRPVAIDEVQRAPDLLLAIKASVDRDRRPGRFLLTGSADFLALPKISETLAGRIELHTLWPFSADELAGREAHFIDALFSTRSPAVEEAHDLRREVIGRALTGGYPEVVLGREGRRAEWFGSYVTTVLQREVRDITAVASLADLPTLLALLAARTMSALNVSEVSRAAEIDRTTLRRYLALLEVTYLIRRIRAWTGGLGGRLLKHPRVTLSDTGLAAHLQGLEGARFAADPALVGPLLENFVAMEIVKQLGWNRTRGGLYHFRSAAGEEVDLVIERPDGRLVGIEVKATSSPQNDHFRGLRALAKAASRKFVRGVVLHTGRGTYPFGENLVALPMSALWEV